MEDLRNTIKNYIPKCEQEEADRNAMLEFMDVHANALLRESKAAHFTASSWIVNRDRSKVLMAYHNLYDSWAWTGGHADGDSDLLAVAMREAKEETGIKTIRPLLEEPVSLEIITVDGHMKNGKYVSSHVHLNLTYLLEADNTEPLTVKPDENSGVKWIPADKIQYAVTEPWMLQWVYRKLAYLL